MSEQSNPPSRKVRPVVTIIAAVVLAFVFTFFLHLPSMEVVAQWQQPAAIPYDERGPYYLSVVKTDLDWQGLPLHVGRNYELYAGRDSGEPTYGHWVKFSFHPDCDEDMPAFLAKCSADWTDAGVELSTPSGHKVFIPADMFTGGR